MLVSRKKFAVVSLGCKVNRAEIDSYSVILLSNGWNFSNIENANLIIVNTCTVTSSADKKTRQMVRKVCRLNSSKDTKIIVTGCAAIMNPSFYKEIDRRIEVVDKINVECRLSKIINTNLDSITISNDIYTREEFRTRASIKIQDGCNNACTYCIVHTARGKSWSKDNNEVLSIISDLLDSGIREIVLTGVNIGAYNYKGIGLEDLCESILELLDIKFPDHDGVPARIRISSIEPQDVSDRLIEIIKNANGRICRHLHLPLQSGSTKVLKEMARHYSADDYLNLVDKLKKSINNISLSTDIIVGFPGESEQDFQQTIDLAKKCGFMKIHVFPYSIRENTPAAKREDQIPDDIKVSRAGILREISDELKLKDLNLRAGHYEYLLVESSDLSRSESYHEIKTPPNSNTGELVKVKL